MTQPSRPVKVIVKGGKSRQVRLAFPNNEFLARVHLDLVPFLKLGVEYALARQGKMAPGELGKLGLPQPLPYVSYVWTKLVAMLESLQRMDFAAAMVRHCPAKRSRLGQLAHFREWREYQSYVFFGSAVGVFDIALVLTNGVYELGIPERRCERDVVVNNAWLERTAAHKALVQLGKSVGEFRKKRNPMLHRGEPPDVSAGFSIETEAIIIGSESGTGVAEFERLAATSRRAVSKELASQWTSLADRLRPPTIALCHSLLPVYERHMQRRPSPEEGVKEYRRILGLKLGDALPSQNDT